jgi:hypothetical protein
MVPSVNCFDDALRIVSRVVVAVAIEAAVP